MKSKSTFAYSSYIIHSSPDHGLYEVLHTRQYNPFLHICWFKNKTVTTPTCLNNLALSKAPISETSQTSVHVSASMFYVYGTRYWDTTQLQESIFRFQVIRKVFTLQPGLQEIKQGWLCTSQILTACPVLENLFFNIIVITVGGKKTAGRDKAKKQVTLQTQQNLLAIRRHFPKRSMNSDNILRGRKFNTLLGELINYNIRLAQGGPFLEWLSEHVSLKDSSNLMGVWPFEPGHGTYIYTYCNSIHKLTPALDT